MPRGFFIGGLRERRLVAMVCFTKDFSSFRCSLFETRHSWESTAWALQESGSIVAIHQSEMLDGVSWCVQKNTTLTRKSPSALRLPTSPRTQALQNCLVFNTAVSSDIRTHWRCPLTPNQQFDQPEIFSIALSCVDFSAMHVENGQNLDRNEPGEHLKLHQISSRWFTGWCKPWIHTQRAYWYGQTHIFTQRVKSWESNGRMMWFCLTNNHQRCVSPMFKNDVFKFHCFFGQKSHFERTQPLDNPPSDHFSWLGICRDPPRLEFSDRRTLHKLASHTIAEVQAF